MRQIASDYYPANLGFIPITPATIEKIANIASKVAPLIQNIFNGKKAKEALAQKGQYDQANVALRSEIATLDSTIIDITNQSNVIASQLKQQGINGFDGFGYGLNGFFDFLRPKKVAEKQLNTAQATYEALSKERDQKLSIAASLLNQLDALKNRLLSGDSVSTLLIALGIAAAAIGIYFISQPTEKP